MNCNFFLKKSDFILQIDTGDFVAQEKFLDLIEMVVFYNCIAVLGKGILIKQCLFTFSENSRTESFGVC